jgi:hypothetical protein
MSSRAKFVLAVGAVAVLFAIPGLASAQAAPKVLQAVIIDVDPGAGDAFMERLAKGQVIFKRLGLPAMRVWFSSLAGPNTGSLVIGVEYPDDVTRAKLGAKLQADAEWQKWVDELQAWGKSRITSNSLLVELTPSQ